MPKASKLIKKVLKGGLARGLEGISGKPAAMRIVVNAVKAITDQTKKGNK